MQTKEEKIKAIQNISVKEFLDTYKTFKQCSEEMGYEDSSWVRMKAKKLNLGVSGRDVGFVGLGELAIYLSPDEQIFLKDFMKEKQKAGRKPKEEKEEGEQ